MAMQFDISDRSALALCDRCRWVEIVTSADIVYRIALEHAWSVHPDAADLIDQIHARQRRRRVALRNA